MKKLLLLIILITALLVTACVKEDVYEDEDGVEDYVNAVVMVHCPGSQGSAVFIDSRGYLLTNKHVLKQQNAKCEVKTTRGATYPVKVVAISRTLDVALMKIEGEAMFSVLALGDSDRVKQGADVIAIGNPVGLESTVTKGTVSSTTRKIKKSPVEVFQIDATIDHGSSGGALVLKDGTLIGITTWGQGSTKKDFNFAIKTNDIKVFLNNKLPKIFANNTKNTKNINSTEKEKDVNGVLILDEGANGVSPLLPFLTDVLSRSLFFVGLTFFFWLMSWFFFKSKVEQDGSPIDAYCTWGGIWMFLTMITGFVSFADMTGAPEAYMGIHIAAWIALGVMTIFIIAITATVKGKRK